VQRGPSRRRLLIVVLANSAIWQQGRDPLLEFRCRALSPNGISSRLQIERSIDSTWRPIMFKSKNELSEEVRVKAAKGLVIRQKEPNSEALSCNYANSMSNFRCGSLPWSQSRLWSDSSRDPFWRGRLILSHRKVSTPQSFRLYHLAPCGERSAAGQVRCPGGGAQRGVSSNLPR
jgi:hypothetical protein